MEFYMWYWILFGLIIFLIIMQVVVASRFKKTLVHYSSVPNKSNKTGAEIAREILAKNGISNVTVIKAGKEGVDHYDPRKNHIMLSPSIYDSSSIAAASVAAHEVGHAIQWGKRELGIRFRDTLAQPIGIISNIGSVMMNIGFTLLIFGLIFGSNSSYGTFVFWILVPGVVVYGATALFQLVTLPIEYNASYKAKKQLQTMGFITTEDERIATKKVLNAAALTYVMALITTLAVFALYLLKLLAIIGSRR
ncbi:zinc metallopeptidase [Candidatus Hepatoplasma crinochetorum]|uniref:Putative neutral zinc metallopeptidase n=2 Tax=Candidatus Hepatoplasma crinochetorum TaxID=295596 RepID=W8GEH7_9MOLU|nr:Putative neutral zinc metallopeptidase [Candidatus Hepatoplasma crinochetorum Av]BDV02796.1 MAG: zinc metallopeptidase [Candidatus Hepatoplasma crinochetorum]